MGGIFDRLTKQGVESGGQTQFYDNPAQVGLGIAKASAPMVHPSIASVGGDIPEVNAVPTSAYTPGPVSASMSTGEQAVPNPGDNPVTYSTPDSGPAPKVVKPAFSDLAVDSKTSNVSPGFKGLTKMGALAKVLLGGAQGGLDAAAGGGLDAPRNGQSSFGTGMRAAQQMPIFRTQLARDNRRADLQDQALEQQAKYVPIMQQLGVMKTQGEIGKDNAQTALYTKQAADLGNIDTLAKMHAAAVEKAISEGRDPAQDPIVQQYADQITGLQKTPAVPMSQDKRDFAEIMSKLSAEGMPAGALNDSRVLASAIKASKVLSPQEKNSAIGYMAANPTPATTGANAVIRLEGLGETRGMPVTDTKTGVTSPMSWNDYNKLAKAEPGRYVSPQYDASTQMGIKAWRDLAPSGAVGKQLTSYDAFINHAGDAWDAVSTLNNTNSNLMNIPMNKIREMGSAPGVKAFIAKIDPVKKEYEKLLVGGALQADDRVAVNKIIDENSTPAEMYAVLPSMAHTGVIRLNSQNDTFKRATGEDIPNLVSPGAAAVMRKFKVALPAGANAQSTQDGWTVNPTTGIRERKIN